MRSATPSTGSAIRVRPSRPLGSVYAPHRYMGDHPLFHNASTAKRFPDLASVPAHELATMFNVDPVDKQQEITEELMFHEPFVDYKEDLRSLPPLPKGAPPFMPISHAAAKRLIAAPPGSVFCGYDSTEELVERRRAERRRHQQRCLSQQPFRATGSSSEARQRIQNNTYLYSLDATCTDAVRAFILRRVKENRRRLLELPQTDHTLSALEGSRRATA